MRTLTAVRVLVTGSNGLLGTKLLALLLRQRDAEAIGVSRAPRTNADLGPLTFRQADLAADPLGPLWADLRPDVVIHTAALTDVDGCERQPYEAWRQNVEATRAVAVATREVGARLLHLSTEYVFDGEAGPYTEDDPPHPLGVYARTKLISEHVAQEILPTTIVGRTTVLFGVAPGARSNFVLGLLQRLRAGQPVRVVTDQVGSPTLADNLAEILWALARDVHAAGVYNTVGATILDRFSFAVLAARVFALDPALIQPIDTASLGQAARRPLRAGLRMDKFRAAYPQVPVRSAQEALEQLRDQLPVLAE